MVAILASVLVAGACASICVAQENGSLLQINSPAAGTIFNPGQLVTVSVTSPSNASFSQSMVIGEDPIGSSDIQNSVPASFSLTIPTDISCGPHMLSATGVTTSGQTASSPVVMIDVERPDMPVSLSGQMPGGQIAFDSLGQQFGIILFATFSDGSVLQVNQSSYVTFASSNTAVATVDGDGMVTGISPGTATITATYTFNG
jgi:hypothetical protein